MLQLPMRELQYGVHEEEDDNSNEFLQLRCDDTCEACDVVCKAVLGGYTLRLDYGIVMGMAQVKYIQLTLAARLDDL